MAPLLGLMMAPSSPAWRAWVKKLWLSTSRWGRPKDTLDTPRAVFTPSSALARRMVSRVTLAFSPPALTGMVRPSSRSSRREMPMSSARRRIFWAMARRPSASAGMPLSSRVRHTRPPPYFFTRGRMAARLSSLPFTELMRGLPLYRRRAASMASGLEVSSCRGRPVTAWMASTVWVSTVGSSRPGRPTFTSRMWAPASSCWKASFST